MVLRLPEGPLRARALAAGAAATAATVAAALVLQAVVPLGPWYAAKAGAGLAAGAAVALAGLRGHHPFPRLGPANQVTLARAVLLGLLVALASEPATAGAATSAVGLASAAIVLDGIDGRLARRHGTASAFGARFDMEVDALLVLVLSLLVWLFAKADTWVLLSGLLRYVFVAAGAAAPWLRQPLPPRRRRQAVCVVQLIGLTAALAPFIRPPLSAALAAVALIALTASFAIDVRWLAIRRATG